MRREAARSVLGAALVGVVLAGCSPVAPPGAVAIGTGDNAQNVVAVHPPGTTFWVTAGTHANWSVVAKTGDTFVAQPGAILNGENTTAQAFPDDNVNNLTIEGTPEGNLLIEHYTDGHLPSMATVSLGHAGQNSSGDLLQYVEVAHSYNTGVGLGNTMVINHVYVHDNDQEGMGGSGGDGSIIENSVIDHNAWNQHWPGGFQAGGIKVVTKANGTACPVSQPRASLTVKNNDISDNGWNGMWTDVGSNGVVIENNTIENNSDANAKSGGGGAAGSGGQGIRIEISCNQLIEGNTLGGNVRVGIHLQSSDDITVQGNVFLGGQQPTTILLGDDGRPPGTSQDTVDNNTLGGGAVVGCTTYTGDACSPNH